MYTFFRFLLLSLLAMNAIAPSHADEAAPPFSPRVTVFFSPFVHRDGATIFRAVCQGCHMPDAKGASGAGNYPALAANPKLASAAYPAITVLKGPNGLFVHKGALYVLDNDSLNRVGKDKKLTVLASGMPGGVDGLENVGGDDFIVSAWGGAIWYVPAKGDKEQLFDGKPTGTHTADMGWDPKTKTTYVPTFFGNSVVAYRVE